MACGYSLSSVVAEICERAGLPYERIDVSRLSGSVQGFQLTSKQPAFTHLRSLSEVFFFDVSNRDGRLQFIPRGGEPVATIDPGEVIEDSEDEQDKRDGVIPRVLHLQYYDITGALEPDKQSSDRSIYIRKNAEATLQTAVVMSADSAARTAAITHKASIEEQRGIRKLALPDSYLALTVGDVVRYRAERMRIYKIEIDEGEQRLELAYDRKSAWSSNATGVQPAPDTMVPQVPAGTAMELLDIPVLKSSHDRLGYYFAAAGSGADSVWQGATIELSTDGGQNYTESETVQNSAVMGLTTGDIGSHSRYYPDNHHTLRVTLWTRNAELEPATLAEMMGRKNRAIIGDEIISFGNAVETSDGVWELSHLLRGRLHTPVTAHQAGERFVLLDGLPYIDAEQYQIGDALTFRATTTASTTQTEYTSEPYQGESQIEPPPGYLRARRDGGNIVIEWVGTGVKGGKTSVQQSDNFTGYRVSINGSAEPDTTDQTLTVTDPGGSVTITVQQVNSITGPGDAAELTL